MQQLAGFLPLSAPAAVTAVVPGSVHVCVSAALSSKRWHYDVTRGSHSGRTASRLEHRPMILSVYLCTFALCVKVAGKIYNSFDSSEEVYVVLL